LRHSQFSHLLASGVPLPAVSARLGHGSIRTTQVIYSHMIHGQYDEAARKWEEFQNQPTASRNRRGGAVKLLLILAPPRFAVYTSNWIISE
jgi:hypothetical protein